MKNLDYEKTRTALRYWMLGQKYYTASRALDYGLKYHTGTRKDGVTPEFKHQVTQASYCRTIYRSLLCPEDTLTTILLHDVVEDIEEVSLGMVQKEFGKSIGFDVELMTNRFENGEKKPLDRYYGEISTSPVASIAKGCDRMHNIQSMSEVFTFEKQTAYISETEEYVLPMLRAARHRFPEQEPAYMNITLVLKSQIELIKETLKVQNNQLTSN